MLDVSLELESIDFILQSTENFVFNALVRFVFVQFLVFVVLDVVVDILEKPLKVR